MPRVDGTTASVACSTDEYCYEASGGAAVSHGAQCRKKPTTSATCAELLALSESQGMTCTPTPDGGLRVSVAFPGPKPLQPPG